MNDPFLAYVRGFESLLHQGDLLAAADGQAPVLPEVAEHAPVCLVFSPHPDDEAIAGALPWRLRAENGWRVVNVAVTLGSKRERRAERWGELERCCAFLGFDLLSASGTPGQAFEQVRAFDGSDDLQQRDAQVARVAALIRHYRARVVVCPHGLDGHPAHIGTHALVMAAVRHLAPDWRLHLLFSEYWNTQMAPALMLALEAADVATLVAALSLHIGEVARNPYHLSLPAWFIDAARRGAERVGSAGAPATGITFAALYGWSCWHQGALVPMSGQVAPAGQSIARLFA
ncbi:MAG TPA: PIG-L family deacetylase [Burkholderiaceae bacterium]|nr:PIG-L family deacetylase [Burkholderiaceae bacterium]